MYQSSTSLDVGQSTTSDCSDRFFTTRGRYLWKMFGADEGQSAANLPRPLSCSGATPAYLIDQIVFDRVIRHIGIVFHPHFFEDAGSISADGLY